MAAIRTRDTKRKILFYRILVNGRTPHTESQARIASAIAEIDKLPHTDDGRYVVEGDEDAVLTLFLDKANSFRFGRIRRQGLPQIADGAKLEEIRVSDKGGLLECSHVVYFAPAILGADFNFHAPRIARIADYLADTAKVNNLEIIPVANPGVLDEIRKLHEIKAVNLKISSTYARRHARAGLLRDIAESADDDNVAQIEVTLSSPRAKRGGPLKASLVREFLGLADRDDIGQGATKFKIFGRRADGARIDSVDILREHLVTEEGILKESIRGKTLDKESAYAAVHAAYTKLRPDRLISTKSDG